LKHYCVGRPFRTRRLMSLHPGLKKHLGYSVRPLRGHRRNVQTPGRRFSAGTQKQKGIPRPGGPGFSLPKRAVQLQAPLQVFSRASVTEGSPPALLACLRDMRDPYCRSSSNEIPASNLFVSNGCISADRSSLGDFASYRLDGHGGQLLQGRRCWSRDLKDFRWRASLQSLS